MKKQIIALFALAVAQMGLAQEETSATLYGYAKGEFAFDSRQVIAAREGNYIDLASPNVTGNNVANFNGWGVESRLGVKVAGPEFFGMKSEALIEAHFFGSSDASINTLALRHAYVKLSSDKVEWLVGQYWHPMFVTNVSPGTYNFNAGSPFQPFNRSPQIRFSTKGNARFTLAAITERDFTSVVYGGGNAAKSGLPAFHAQLQFGSDEKFVGGFGANVKFTRNTGADHKTAHGKTLAAFNVLAYAKAQFTENFAWKIYGNFGQNPSELLQLGSVAYSELDLLKDNLKNSTTLSLWTEFAGKFSDSFEWGVFGGYSKDFGFNENNFLATYKTTSKYAGTATAGLIPGSTWRVSPRVGWKSGNTKLGVEFDYTSTTYGNFDNKGKIEKLAKNATGDNLRVSLSLTQTF